jgi:hypothetical protein
MIQVSGKVVFWFDGARKPVVGWFGERGRTKRLNLGTHDNLAGHRKEKRGGLSNRPTANRSTVHHARYLLLALILQAGGQKWKQRSSSGM